MTRPRLNLHRFHRALFLVWLVASLLPGAGCKPKPVAKRYELNGRVVGVDSASQILTIAHEDVPGLMKGMTMPFQVSNKDAWVFQRIKPGDKVHATLVLTDKAILEDISFTTASQTEGDGTSNLRIPEPGDEVPDFEVVNQDGKTIHLAQLRGKPLLLTFIYTRCPLPNYCLLMSHNFAEVLRDLLKRPNDFAEAQLLSISIDPEFDKPAVLRKYGASFVGRADPHFLRWQFASGSPEQVRQVADWFGLAYDQHDGQIVHSLRTVLIGKDGKIVKVYSGNDWKPENVAADFAAAAHS